MSKDKKKIAISQSNYIPWKGYFEMIRQSDVFVLYDEVQYTTRDWRNRNLIKSKSGLQWLTIPVHGSQSDIISQVEVSGQHWRKKHWDTLQQNYGKANYFNEYAFYFKELYLGSNETNLSRINQSFILLVCQLLGIQTKIVRSEEVPHFALGKTERLVEIVKYLDGQVYISGPKAKAYIQQSLLDADKIELVWMDYQHFPEYEQLYPPFVHTVSILDLIFHQGISSLSFMQPNWSNAAEHSKYLI